jgi:hypothetical protein
MVHSMIENTLCYGFTAAIISDHLLGVQTPHGCKACTAAKKRPAIGNGWPREFRTTDQAAFVLRNFRMLPTPPQTSTSAEAPQP